VDLLGKPAPKHRKLPVPKLAASHNYQWKSKHNLEEKVMKSSEEVGDGGSSEVYKGSLEGKLVAVKELRAYAPRHASKLIAAYDELLQCC